jgi:alpha-1,2-mannosyltransferase
MAVLSTVLVIAALVGCVRAIDGRRRLAGRRRLSLFACAAAALVMAVSTPAVSNMALGQVSFGIAALVVLDVLVLPRRWRGTLVGLAGAVKLTPMILVPYYLVTRQWRAAVNASVTFGVATVIGAALRWSDSIRYWLHPDVVRSTLGTLRRTDNWSIYGVLARTGLGGSVLTVAWVVLSALVVGLALWRARRHFRSGQLLEATLVMGLIAGLVTVATWPHHVLFLMLACVLMAVQRPLVGFPVLVGFTLACYVIPDSIGDWAVLLMAVLVVVGIRDFRRSSGHPTTDAPAVAEPPADPVAAAAQ